MMNIGAIIDGILAGDRNAYEQIVRKHQEMLTAFAAFRLSDPSLVEEAVQQTFIRAYRQLADFQTDKDFGVWLRAICRYVILAELKRLQRRQENRKNYKEHLEHQITCGFLQQAGAEPGCDLVAALNACLGKLSEKSRKLIDFKYGDKSSVKDIAARLSRSTAWVATTLFRIRDELRKCIERKAERA